MKKTFIQICKTFHNVSKDRPRNNYYYRLFMESFQQNKRFELYASLAIAIALYGRINEQNYNYVTNLSAAFSICISVLWLIHVIYSFVNISRLDDIDFTLNKKEICEQIHQIEKVFINLRIYLIFSFVIQFIVLIKQDHPSAFTLSYIMFSIGFMGITDLYIARLSTLFNYRERLLL